MSSPRNVRDNLPTAQEIEPIVEEWSAGRPQPRDGHDGATGAQGPKGDTGDVGPQGPKGDKGDSGNTGPAGPTGPAGAKGDTGAAGATGAQGPIGLTGATGSTGAAGPTGAAGTNASVLVGSVTLTESSLVTLSIAVRRPGPYTLAGTVTTGNYIAIPVSAPPAGYSIQDCYCSTNGQITVGVIVPVLAVASSYSIPVRIYRIN